MANRAKWVKAAALVVAAMMPLAFAGGEDCQGHAKAAKAAHASNKKCSYGTQECLDHMASKFRTGGWVGIEMEKDDATGVLTVLKVIPGSPAETAGFQAGDVLFALNGVEINEANESALKAAKKDWQPGQRVNYTVKRGGRDQQVHVTLGLMPEEVLARFVGQHMLEHSTTEVASR